MVAKQPGYSLEGLQEGIVRARHNIGVLKEAIKTEEATIKEYRTLIGFIENKVKREAKIQLTEE